MDKGFNVILMKQGQLEVKLLATLDNLSLARYIMLA